VDLRIIADKISKSFTGKQYIFRNITFEITNGDVLGVCGPNGSGKSTLLKIISGVMTPTKGRINWQVDNKNIDKVDFYQYFGFVAPYLSIYEEFTPTELIKIVSKIRKIDLKESDLRLILENFYLFEHRNKQIRNFSSGMKQRMKLLLSKLHNPYILIYDEPTTNLDEKGIELVYSIIERQKATSGIVIIASNDERELIWCSKKIFVTNQL